MGITEVRLADELHAAAKCLREAPRIGGEMDVPEGNRCIQLSDTLAEQIADCCSNAEQLVRRVAQLSAPFPPVAG